MSYIKFEHRSLGEARWLAATPEVLAHWPFGIQAPFPDACAQAVVPASDPSRACR